MSLDVYLYEVKRCPHCSGALEDMREVFHANITHNLSSLADAAGLYMHVWRPEEIGVTRAADLVAPLRSGIAWMETNEAQCREFNAPNGWGTYEQFLPWLRRYLSACEANPDALVEVSR